MLPVVMLMDFHDANAGYADLVEGAVVTAAGETVETVYEHNVEVRHVLIGLGLNIAGEVTRRTIDFTASETAGAGFGFGFIGAGAL